VGLIVVAQVPNATLVFVRRREANRSWADSGIKSKF